MLRQQGDVLINDVNGLPEGLTVSKTNVLAEGEATGHAHRVAGSGATVLDGPGVRYLSAPNGAEVTHEEHGPQTLPPGNYKIEIVQEYDHFEEEARDVLD